MNKRKLLFWTLGGVLLISGFFVGASGILGCLPWQKGDLYADPEGRFTVELGPGWERVETAGPYMQFQLADQPGVSIENPAMMDDFRVLAPWGGLFGTPGDVTHFLQMYLNDGHYEDIQILESRTVASMEEMQFSTDGSPLGFGLSWMPVEDDLGTFYYHSGGHTIESTMRYDPDWIWV